jgi:hypothetical protein
MKVVRSSSPQVSVPWIGSFPTATWRRSSTGLHSIMRSKLPSCARLCHQVAPPAFRINLPGIRQQRLIRSEEGCAPACSAVEHLLRGPLMVGLGPRRPSRRGALMLPPYQSQHYSVRVADRPSQGVARPVWSQGRRFDPYTAHCEGPETRGPRVVRRCAAVTGRTGELAGSVAGSSDGDVRPRAACRCRGAAVALHAGR